MLAARDQENRLFSQQAAGAAKQQGLQPKTPGARFPKTPLKIPLNDENANRALGGKSVLGERANGGGNENMRTIGKSTKTLDKSNLFTPLEPRTNRAPLGNKTTNAKARTGQATGVKQLVRDIEKTQAQPTTVRRPTVRSPQADSFKLEIHNDKDESPEERDIEYCPPKPLDLPYQSDVFPDGVLTFDAFKPENRLKGYYDYYYNPVDENGVSLKEKLFAEEQQKAFDKLDERVRKDMEEFDWSVADIPGSKDLFKKHAANSQPTASASTSQGPSRLGTKPPSTIASRKAAALLSAPSRSKMPLQPKAVKPVNAKAKNPLLPGKKTAQPLPKDSTTGAVASRTTIGYTKGRTASSLAQGGSTGPNPGRTFTRTPSTASAGSDTTITPSRFAQKNSDSDALKRFEFLSIFDVDEEDDGNLGGSQEIPNDELDDGFQLNVKF